MNKQITFLEMRKQIETAAEQERRNGIPALSEEKQSEGARLAEKYRGRRIA